MSKYVYSKLANDVVITDWHISTDGKHPKVKKSVLINGGAGVVNKKTLDTPQGAMTEVSDEDAEFLKHNSSFKRQEKAGYLKMEGAKKDIEKAVSDMVDRDKGDQLQEIDFEPEKAPKTAKSSNNKPKAKTRKQAS